MKSTNLVLEAQPLHEGESGHKTMLLKKIIKTSNFTASHPPICGKIHVFIHSFHKERGLLPPPSVHINSQKAATNVTMDAIAGLVMIVGRILQ